MDKTDRNTIEELLPRYCEGVATEEERLQVEMWMSESDENRRMAKQIHLNLQTFFFRCHHNKR